MGSAGGLTVVCPEVAGCCLLLLVRQLQLVVGTSASSFFSAAAVTGAADASAEPRCCAGVLAARRNSKPARARVADEGTALSCASAAACAGEDGVKEGVDCKLLFFLLRNDARCGVGQLARRKCSAQATNRKCSAQATNPTGSGSFG